MKQIPDAKNPVVVVDPPIGNSCIVHNTKTRKYFKLGFREASFLESLDGVTSREELRAGNCAGFKPEEVDYLLDQFEQMQLIGHQPEASNVKPLHRQALDVVSGREKWRVHLLDPDRFLDRHIGIVHALFARPALLCYLLILLGPLGALIAAPELLSMVIGALDVSFSLVQWLGLYASLLAVIAVHEMAHAVTCKHYGGKVHDIGVMLLYLQPVAYCDISDSWRFSSREQKLAVAAAGIFVQVLISCIVFLVWIAAGSPVLLYFSLVNAAIALFNFFPFVKLDGYWMLVHALDEPNLRAKGLGQIDRLVRRVLGTNMKADSSFQPGLFIFGVASAAAAILFWGLGCYAIHKYAALVSADLALTLTAMFCLYMVWRAVVAVRSYIRAF